MSATVSSGQNLRKSKKFAIIASKGGATMADRNYATEYQKRMETNSQLAIKIPKKLFEDFSAKIEQEGTTKRAVLVQLIEGYTYNS
jgi:hypothetical protein